METSVKQVLQPGSSGDLEIQKRKLKDNCREFESVMTSYMMKAMRQGVSWADEHDSAREMYEDMLAGQVSKEVSRSSAMGIGDMLYSKLEPLLKTQPAPALSDAVTDLPVSDLNGSSD
jgi:Rod binding domain-containing protein